MFGITGTSRKPRHAARWTRFRTPWDCDLMDRVGYTETASLAAPMATFGPGDEEEAGIGFPKHGLSPAVRMVGDSGHSSNDVHSLDTGLTDWIIVSVTRLSGSQVSGLTQPFHCIAQRGECTDSEASLLGAQREEPCVVESFGWDDHGHLSRERLPELVKLACQIPKVGHRHYF